MDSKSGTKLDLETLLGFSDELQKIAGFAPAQMKGLTDVTKVVDRSKKALTSRPSAISKASRPEAQAQSPDFLSSTKTNPPPPVTSGS